MTKPTLEDFLSVSDEMQNELVQLAKKLLAREPLTGAERALVEKIQAVRSEITGSRNK
jgi:hypothetical protein